jgi:phosphoribosylformylglycinamidine cyclo-ligase
MAGYRKAGVDLDAADAVVAQIGPAVTSTWHAGVVGGFGGFAAGLELPAGYARPVLMMSTDGVGTKAEVARMAGSFDGLGFDLVAMCVDDLAAAGAKPVAMTDYIAIGHLDVATVSSIVSSIAAACRSAGVALIGGETAEHPGVMDRDAFDVAGTALGVVERDAVIDGSRIAPGDAVIGIDSPNFRSNGFSLLRAVFAGADLGDEFPGTGRSVASVLLEPSVVYSPVVMNVVAAAEVHGLAHVTGGGLTGNLSRILPDTADAVVDGTAWDRPAAFDVVAAMGDLDEAEMRRTFNMGIGFVVVVPARDTESVVSVIETAGRRAWQIGEIRHGTGTARIV